MWFPPPRVPTFTPPYPALWGKTDGYIDTHMHTHADQKGCLYTLARQTSDTSECPRTPTPFPTHNPLSLPLLIQLLLFHTNVHLWRLADSTEYCSVVNTHSTNRPHNLDTPISLMLFIYFAYVLIFVVIL